MERKEQLLKILLAIFVMLLSCFVLVQKVPESSYIKNSIESLEECKDTVMEFSGAVLATSVAISALPDDFATPLADSLADMNIYFILIFAVLVIEKLIVAEGIKATFLYLIPVACVLCIFAILLKKDALKSFAVKLVILGAAVVLVIPFSTHFVEKVCDDYLVYVEETIESTENGADKVNEIMAEGTEESTIFDRLSDAFKTSIQGVTDLLTHFKNVIRRCVNSIAILIVTSCILPLTILFVFKWLLSELFHLNLSVPNVVVKLPVGKQSKETKALEEVCKEEKE